MELTDEQAMIIGRNIGIEIANRFERIIIQFSPDVGIKLPLEYIVTTFARELGEGLRNNQKK